MVDLQSAVLVKLYQFGKQVDMGICQPLASISGLQTVLFGQTMAAY